ncbi:MAG: hypothetical protein AAFZ17_01815 [Cyanobacteria bacterium J06650_10]
MALVQAAPIMAVVAHIMDEKTGKYGSYQSVLFESSRLQDGKLWWALKPNEAKQLRIGQAVELTPTTTSRGKDSWNIRPLDTQQVQQTQPRQSQPAAQAHQPAPQPAAQSLPPGQAQITENRRQQIEAFVFSMANLHAVCYQAAEQAYVGMNVPDEVIRAATSSVFIAAERRFRLCSPAD